MVNPWSTGITLSADPRRPRSIKSRFCRWLTAFRRQRSATTFPWIFNPPDDLLGRALSMIFRYIGGKEGGLEKLKGKTIGYIFFDGGYRPRADPAAGAIRQATTASRVQAPIRSPVAEMQNQAAQWLNVRRDRPDCMINWGWGAMNLTAVKEAAKINYPMDKFVSVYWGGGEDDARPTGAEAKGFTYAGLHGDGNELPGIAGHPEATSSARPAARPRRTGSASRTTTRASIIR